METSNIDAWAGYKILPQLNDIQPSIDENILENVCISDLITLYGVDNDNVVNDSTIIKVDFESGTKIPKSNGESKEKNYVLQIQEEMTQDFVDYFKKMSKSEEDVDNATFQIKCQYCQEVFSLNDFEFHLCDFDENSPFDNRSIMKQLKENNAMIVKLLNNNFAQTAVENKSQPKVKEVVKNKKKNGPYECTLCDRKFIYESGLTSHMGKHALECPLEPKLLLKEVVKCLKCSQVLHGDSIGIFIDHFVNDHGYSVDSNGFEEELKEANAEPMSIDDMYKCIILNLVFQCEFCELLFCDVNGLLNHSASHDPKLGFECTLCKINVTTLKQIISHRQTECPLTDVNRNIGLQTFFVCNVCDSKFLSLEYLYDHRNQSRHFFPRKGDDLNGFLDIGCEKCDIVLNSAETASSHIDEHYVRKSIWRNLEANTVPTVSTFDNSRNRKYLCEVCGKTYTQSSHLWQHLRFHQGIKPFVCSEPNCNRKFTIRPDLNDHVRKCHTGERPYHCLICGKRFLTGSVFYQHRLIHRGERRYGCDQCSKRFYRADALKNHLRIHSGERPYPCTHCPKSFRQRGDREKHIRARHSVAKMDMQMQPSISKLQNKHIVLDGPVRSKKELLLRNQLRNALKMQQNIVQDGLENVVPVGMENVVQVGGVSFPQSMFRPILTDIDPNLI